jgi:hypothetical protein
MAVMEGMAVVATVAAGMVAVGMAVVVIDLGDGPMGPSDPRRRVGLRSGTR